MTQTPEQPQTETGEKSPIYGPDGSVLSTPQEIQAAVEAAALRPEAPDQPATTEALRQMGIAAADRANRQEAGLPPRVHDLR